MHGYADKPKAGRRAGPGRGGEGHWSKASPTIAVLCFIGFVALKYQQHTQGAHVSLDAIFGLMPARAFGRGEVWRLFTYMLLHEHFLHLLTNLVALFCFGALLERELGARRFLCITLLGGLVGGLASCPMYFLIPGIRVLGLSGAVYAILATYVRVFGERPLIHWRGLDLRARHAAFLMLLLAYLGAALAGPFANAGQVVGLLAGWGFMALEPCFFRWWVRWQLYHYEQERVHSRQVRRRVDELLDKVHGQGIGALTRKERRFLKNASRLYKRWPRDVDEEHPSNCTETSGSMASRHDWDEA